jgi:hypothetical protein
MCILVIEVSQLHHQPNQWKFKMSIYARLGFNFDTAKFDGADTLSPGVLNFLGNTSINLSQWQIDDISSNTVYGYFQNPHNDNLGVISVFVTGIASYANTINYNYNNTDLANTMANVALSTYSSLQNFANHTNNLSGVTVSTDATLYPDLNLALAVGRQMLNITNKSDGVQNNVPILGNFTSLYIGPDLSAQANVLANDYIVLSNSFSGANSNVSNATMNTIIFDIQTLQTLIDDRRNGDITFYTNSNEIMQEYFTVLQFSNLGATQNSLIELIGTDKLKEDLS